MEECFKCGISEQNAKLHNAISGEGIVKVCDRCSIDGDVPVLRRKEVSLEKADKTAPVGGLIREREKAFEQMKSGKKGHSIRNADFSLRDLVEQNYRKNVDDTRTWPGVTRNFNWVIMRARRNKGFGQKQLADMMGEPEIAVRMAERGVLPKEYVPFIRKVERALQIELMGNHPFRLEEHKKMLDFKSTSPNNITIKDLRDATRKKQVETIKSPEIISKEAREAQELLDEPENLSEPSQKKDSSPGFFKKLFSRKEKSLESEGIEKSDSFEDDQNKDTRKPISSTNSQSKDAGKFTSSTNSQSKETVKLDSTTPGRTKSVPKYRWQH